MANWKTSSAIISNTAQLTQVVAAIPTVSFDSASGSSAKGLVPSASTTDVNAGKFLRADAIWAIPPGGGESRYFIFQQMTAATIWDVAHNFGRIPQVRVFTIGGQEIEADILNISNNVVRITLTMPMAGTAICL